MTVMQAQNSGMQKAVILVGGPSRGTRFRPLSLNTPKPLFPIAGEPLLFHHINALSQGIDNLSEVLIFGFFEESVFADFLKTTQKKFKFPIRYFREYQALDTAGGLYHFRDTISRGNPDSFFVLHVDTCCTPPLKDMLEIHASHDALCTLLTKKVSRDIAQKFGCVAVDEISGEVRHYVEKPETFISNTISCGVYLFSTQIFDYISNIKMQRIADDAFENGTEDRIRLEHEVLPSLAGSGRLFVCQIKDHWQQIKTGSSTIPANRHYLNWYSKTLDSDLHNPLLSRQVFPENGPEIIEPVFIHSTAIISSTAKIGPNVSIGAHVKVDDGVRIKDSIILDNATIRESACILNSIIGWDSRVGSWCRVEGDINDAPKLHNGGKGQSTSIIGNNVSLGDEKMLRNCIVLPHKEIKVNVKNEILM